MLPLLAAAKLLQKMAKIHDDPRHPKTVYRIEGDDEEGPYGSSGMDTGVPQMAFSSKYERPNKDFYQPLPEHDFTPEDYEELMGQGPEGHGAGHYSFAFERPEHAVRWHGRDQLRELYEHGYRLREVPAAKVYSSASGSQVFFEHAPRQPKRHRDAQGFDHPLPRGRRR